jgi:hypothetical protein
MQPRINRSHRKNDTPIQILRTLNLNAPEKVDGVLGDADPDSGFLIDEQHIPGGPEPTL